MADETKWLSMLVDSFEPTGDIVPMLQQSIPVQVVDQNLQGFADYLWTASDLHLIQAERKQNGELLSSLAKVEDQLRRQYDKADENLLIIEGFIIPSSKGCYTLKRSKDNRYFFIDREYEHTTYGAFLSWCYQLDKVGITVYTTPDLRGTAILLTSLYQNAQKSEHTTLNRYLKKKIFIKEQNPQVLNLMGLKGVNIGEVKAKALVEVFGSLWGVLMSSPEELITVQGIGKKLAVEILRAGGRHV